jgi:hypothetical protein
VVVHTCNPNQSGGRSRRRLKNKTLFQEKKKKRKKKLGTNGSPLFLATQEVEFRRTEV